MQKSVMITRASGHLGQSVLDKLKSSGFQIFATLSSGGSAEALRKEGIMGAQHP
ncbi:MAG: hypothetical protein HC880_10390 [Bacteroidia bacterium]|nr:hypothetical protein [Bacteroidia bacterium]